MRQPKAVLWDLDGVIADTAPFHFAAWQAAFSQQGIIFTEEDFRKSFGQRNETIIPRLLGRPVSPEELNEFSRQKEADFRRRAGQGLSMFPGVKELLEQLKAHGFRQALASSTPGENIDFVFRVLGIGHFFEAVVSAEDVRRGKPDPDVFLLASSKIEATPERCLVIEDAVAGVAAAKTAGMKCLAVTNTNPAEKLKQADLVVDSLAKVSWVTIDKLLSAK